MSQAFRHLPGLRTSRGEPTDVCWRREPAITAFRRIQFTVPDTGQVIDVPISATPVVVDGVGVLVVSDDGFARFFKEDLSRPFWERQLPATLYASPVYVEDEQLLVVASQGGHVVAFELLGKVRWHATVDHPVYGSPGLDLARGALYVSTFRHELHAYDFRTGQRRWTAELPRPWAADLGAPQAMRDPYASPVVGDDGAVYLTSAEYLHCFEPNGRLRWRLDTGDSVRASPAVDGATRTCVIATVRGEVWLIDTGTATVRRRFATGGKVLQSPAVAGARGFVGNELGRVLAFELATGEVAWQRELGAGLDHGSITLTPDGDPAFVAGSGNILCLAASDGSFLWETSQVLDEPDHDRRMNGTPVIAPSGVMIGAGYSGYLYRFQFRSIASVDAAREGKVVVAAD